MEVYRAEFLVEPFTEGSLGPPVMAGIEAVRSRGFDPEIGAFGTTIEGDRDAIVGAVSDLVNRTMDAGATRVSIQITKAGE